MSSRLRDSFEAVLRAEHAPHGDGEGCRTLEAAIAAASASFAEYLQRTVERHIAMCPACRGTKGAMISPSAIFAGLSLMQATPAHRSAIWHAITQKQPPN